MAESTSLDETSEKPVVAEIDTVSSSKDPSAEVPQLRVDKHGLPCVPQPSHWRDDPLVRLKTQAKRLKRLALIGSYRTGHLGSNGLF